MKAGLTGHLKALLRTAGSVFGGQRLPEGRPDDDSACDDSSEIDAAVAAFRQLITRISRDGNELSELYLQAERKAASCVLLSETVVESVTSGIMVVERSFELRLVNSSARRLLGLSQELALAGRRLGKLFQDGTELERLLDEDMRIGRNSSRRVVSVRSLDGTMRRLGVSTTCVVSSSSRVDAIIVVFTELKGEGPRTETAQDEHLADAERQNYLRGVLDSYDLMSDLLVDFDKIEAKSTSGTLTRTELDEFCKCVRRTCDTMMAFALSLDASSSITELVDVNCVIESIMARRKTQPGTLNRNLCKHLPAIKTVKKILETGLELLVAGCTGESAAGIEITTGLEQDDGTGVVIIIVKELSQTRPVRKVGHSLREMVKGQNMLREAGLLLLASLPAENHLIEAESVDGFFHFSIKVQAPINKEAGQDKHEGDTTKRVE
jgi:PAS domain-containing protein